MTGSLFMSIFGRTGEVYAQAPGRVNVMGDHIDYNGGLVLPIGLKRYTRLEVSRRTDAVVCAASGLYPNERPVAYTLGQEERSGGWADYVQGVTCVLSRHGYRIKGFDVAFSTDIPIGGGLSSSAALEVCLLRGLRELFGLSLDDLVLARLAQEAETDFVGAPVGIMDQMASSLADAGHALLINTRTLAFERVPWPDTMELIIADSGTTHHHAGGGYAQRREECRTIGDMLQVQYLVDVPCDRMEVRQLPAVLQRRLRHVVRENRRVTAAVEAMERNDLGGLGRLFYQSHASLRDDYEVSLPEIDRLVECARLEDEIAGARLTGGGFGGAVIFLGARGRTADAVGRVIQRAASEGSSSPRLLGPACG